jgi:hypothetical protein
MRIQNSYDSSKHNRSESPRKQMKDRMKLKLSQNAMYFIIIIFNLTPLMVKLKVSMLCFNHFMDIFNLFFILHFGVIDNCLIKSFLIKIVR